MCRSEVAQIRRQIELEIEAMRLGMEGLSVGSTRHDFIFERMERVGACEDSLARHLGETTAHHIVCQLYIKTMEAPELAFDTNSLSS
jgi:hypothetical protein